MTDATDLFEAVKLVYDAEGLITLTNIRDRSKTSITEGVGDAAAQSVIDLWPAYAEVAYEASNALHEEAASTVRLTREMAELHLAAETLQADLTAKTHRLQQTRQAREGLEEILARPSVTRCKHCARILRLMDLAQGVCPNPSCQRTGFDVLPGYGQRRPAEILGEALAFVSGIGQVAAFLKGLEDTPSEP